MKQQTALNQAKAQLAQLCDELADRRSKAANATQRKAELTQRLSSLRAGQALDGADHSQRIAAIEAEQAEIAKVLDTWPDVEAELRRRITAAQAEVDQIRQAQQLDEFAQLLNLESDLRQQYSAQALAFVELGRKLSRALETKQSLYNAIVQAGGRVQPGDIQMPPFSRFWMFSDSGVTEAVAALQGHD